MVEATTSSRRDPSLIRSDVSIAVARTAVVVGVMVATVVLRDSVPNGMAYDPGAGGRDGVPHPAEGVQLLALGLALLRVLDEPVERVVVVGHLQPSIGTPRRPEQ